MDTRTTNILTHMGSLALTEMERDVNNRVDVSAAPSHDANEQNVYNMDVDIFFKSFFGYTTPVNSVKSEKPASKKDPSAPRKRSYDPDL